MADLSKLKRIVDIEYNDITSDSVIYHDKLRVFIRDGSIVESGFQRRYRVVSHITGREDKSMGRYIAMTISRIPSGKESLRFLNTFITVHKIEFRRAK